MQVSPFVRLVHDLLADTPASRLSYVRIPGELGLTGPRLRDVTTRQTGERVLEAVRSELYELVS